MNRQFYPDRQQLQERYAHVLPSYISALEMFQARLRAEVCEIDVHFTIKYRVKTFASYYAKLLKRKAGERHTGEAIPIHDVLGTRIVCPFLEDVGAVEECLRNAFVVHEVEHKGSEHTFREFGYSSTHLLIEIPRDIDEQFPDLDLKVAEVQIRTFLQDAWAEVEHELIYKNSNSITPLDEPLRRKLAALNANLSLSDDIFQEIRDYQRRLHTELNKRRYSFTAQLDDIKPGLTAAAAMKKKKIAAVKESVKDDTVKTVEVPDTPLPNTHNNKDQLLLNALNAHNEKNFPLAIGYYTRILEQDTPPYIKALVLLHRGKAYFTQSNYCEALKDFQAATESEPTNNRAFYHLGIVNRILDDNHAAMKALQTCIEINPFHIDALFALGRVYFDMGDYTGALEYCEKALLVEPDSGSAKEFRKLVMSRMKM
ncbi:MAG: tetratricopeptide repeat protein [Chitinispirillales bacterium]|jgi:putative GTP pyrophosphokinase|nr:tetratricopeptide repeat protein [Chitinispirillales bacterium]